MEFSKAFDFMKVLLPAKDIPIGSIVTRPTGEKKYELRDKIEVSPHQKIEADPNTRFLVGKDMSFIICAISGESELAWEVSPEELYNFIYDKYISDHK